MFRLMDVLMSVRIHELKVALQSKQHGASHVYIHIHLMDKQL